MVRRRKDLQYVKITRTFNGSFLLLKNKEDLLRQKKYTNEEMVELLKSYNYTYLSGEYDNCKSKIKCVTNDGYIVFISLDKLLNKDSKPRLFHPSNPYSTDNIQTFLQNNSQYLCKYHAGIYKNNDSILEFECECGNIFKTTFDNVRSFHKNRCDMCTGFTKNLTYNDVKNNLENKGFYLQIKEQDYKIGKYIIPKPKCKKKTK